MNSGYLTILDYLERVDYVAHANPETLTVDTRLTEAGPGLPLRIIMHPGNSLVRLATPLPFDFAPGQRVAAAELCVRASLRLPLGYFGMPIEGGEVTFSSYAQFPVGTLEDAILGPLVEAHRDATSAYYPAFRAIQEEGVSATEALTRMTTPPPSSVIEVTGDGGLRYDVSLEPDDQGKVIVYGTPEPSTRGLRVVVEMFRQAGFEFEEDYKHYSIRTGFRLTAEGQQFPSTFTVGPKDNRLDASTLVADHLSAEQCRLMPALCAHLSQRVWQGCFKCDLDEGRVYFHTSVPYPQYSLSTQVCNHYLGMQVFGCAQFYPSVDAVLEDSASLADAIALGESRENHRPPFKFDCLQW
jgi:hypothetical protein